MTENHKLQMTVRIPASEIPSHEDKFPNRAALEAMQSIIEELDEMQLGQYDDAGGGVYDMYIAYFVSDQDAAEEIVEQAIKKFLPSANYKTEFQSLN